MADKLTRYVASMVLSGAGDALGYNNGHWEFCHSGEEIHKELKAMGGLQKVIVALPKWMISDDTVMNIATAEALVEHGTKSNKEELYLKIAEKYKACMSDMNGRAPGMTTVNAVHSLKPRIPGGYQIPFNPRGGGCGAAMRSMSIGLRYPRPEELKDLIAVSVESGRMTHHHPTGFLGSLASALFVSYAIQRKPLKEWGSGLLSVLPAALEYIKSQGRFAMKNSQAWGYFTDKWADYLLMRGISDGKSEPRFRPEDNTIKGRDKLYKSLSFQGWGGASGHDAPMIAYDALLGAGDSWEALCSRGMFHSGDSDSTGVIAAACFGALYGFHGVPEVNYKHLEYRHRLSRAAEKLYHLAHPDANPGGAADDKEAKAAAAVMKDIVEKVSSEVDENKGHL